MTPQDVIINWPRIQAAFNREGVVINLQQGLAVLQDLSNVTDNPPHNDDAIDINTVTIIGGSPDVRSWPITTKITSLQLSQLGVQIEFDAKNRWPNVRPPGWEGDLQYTLWVFLKIGGNWYGVGCIEYWTGLAFNGGDMSNPGVQMRTNWFYYAAPMNSYTPTFNEEVGFMVTAGDARRKDVHAVEERSNIVVVGLQPALHVYTFE